MTIRTQYASGRNKLPAPSLSATSGSIAGGGLTYNFWIKARNRVGYNLESNPSTVVLGANSGILINSSTFASYAYEGWREILLFVSNTNNFSNSRVIYKQKLYNADEVTPITLTNIAITDDYIINGLFSITDTVSFPDTTHIPNGYRLNVASNSKTYEYIKNIDLVADNVNTFTAISGIWSTVNSNSLTEISSTYRKELFEVTESELYTATINNLLNNSVPITYYLLNDSLVPFSNGELDLNSYCSDISLNYTFEVKILGYFNYTTNILDITGITYINTLVEYPSTKITLSKALPANSALVVQIKPDLGLNNIIPEGIFITLYPKLNDYSTVDALLYWGNPVVDLAALRAIPFSNYLNNQVRFVSSLNKYYSFNDNNTDIDNGEGVIVPNNNPSSGRWLSVAVNIADASITPVKLAQNTIDLFTEKIDTTTVDILNSVDYIINLDSNNNDYYIINTPVDDTGITSINVTATLANNETKAIVIELRQNTGAVVFDSSLLFPGGNVPVFSGSNKIDLFIVEIIKDNIGTVKKRIFLAQKDIG